MKTIGSLTFGKDDLVDYNPNTGTAILFFDGGSLFPNTQENIDAVHITTNAGNNAPLATADGYSVNEDNTLNIAAAGVLANDSDPDSDSLTAVLVSRPANGILTLKADGSFDYTPDANFIGTDSFTYKVNDGTDDSNTATVTISVNEQNDAPPTGDDGDIDDGDIDENILPILDDAPETRDDPPIQLDPVAVTPYVSVDDLFSGSSPLLDFPDSDESGDELGGSTAEDDPEISEETSEEGEPESSSEPAQEGEPVAESENSQAGIENSPSESETDGHFEALVGPFLPPEVLALFSGKTEFSHLLDEMEEEINQSGNISFPEITIVSTTLLTAGYVLYDLRKLCFIFTAISSIPHWRQFDLLSVLNTDTNTESNSKRQGTNPLLEIVHGG